MTDFNAEAREAAERIPDPEPRPCADVLAFPSPSDRWRRQWTRPFDDKPTPDGPVAA